MLQHKEAIISHLSWVSLFLGFHTLVFMFTTIRCGIWSTRKANFIEPVFAQWIQAASGKALYGFDVLLSSAR